VKSASDKAEPKKKEILYRVRLATPKEVIQDELAKQKRKHESAQHKLKSTEYINMDLQR